MRKSVDEPPDISTVDQLTAMLAAASPEVIPAIVIGAFAGLRTAELMRLVWSHIDIARGSGCSLIEAISKAREGSIAAARD